MTLKNSKRLYEHFISVGNLEAAQELVIKHPELKPKKEEPKPEPKKETSKKYE